METVLRGKKIVVFMIMAFLLISIITTCVTSSSYTVNGRTDYAFNLLFQGIFRFILECVILFFLYKGHKWAKWLTVILFLIGGLIGLISLLSYSNIIITLIVIVYITFGITFLTSKSVKDFLRYQKGDFQFINETKENSDNE